jgi:predicted TIM-barrel fold metal-dependent hydrolase
MDFLLVRDRWAHTILSPVDSSHPWPEPSWLAREQLAAWRTWDALFVPSPSSAPGLEQAIEGLMPYFDRFGIERLCTYFHLGMGTAGRRTEFSADDSLEIQRCLDRWPQRLIGCAVLNATAPERCLEHIDRWIQHGPMVGVLFTSSPQTLPCSHPNFDRLVPRLHESGALIVQHTWFKNGGKGSAGESTPDELAELARRYPETTFVCVHAGGEWEKGLRAIRDCPNVLVEISGFDPTAGFLEMAVREIGATRILFARERSFATELGKVLGAEISDDDRRLILGGNLRRVLAPMFRRKGWSVP